MSDYRAYLATLGLSRPVALEGFLEAAPDAIVVVDRSANIVIVNQLAERLFGYSRQELLGMPIEGLVPQRFMIEQILDFARIRSGQSFELQLESADLRQVCQYVIDELRLSRPDQEIALSLEGRADGVFDSDRIAQVLSNLIGNAVQHGTGGPISVTVRETTPDTMAIEVHNVGPAIPPGAQAGLFDAFNRAATTGDRGFSVGLGLFIANQIVRAHGGSIAVQSPDRDGTTFRVILPRRPAIGWNPMEAPPPQLH